MNRRAFLQSLVPLGLAALSQKGLSATTALDEPVPQGREGLLDEIERRACRYFFDEADPITGLVRDRARMEGNDERTVASIAATGFGLSALCIAEERGYLNRNAVWTRVMSTLTYLAEWAPHEQGFFYHFLDMHSGQRAWHSELSSIDTAWLLCGVLHCRSHFDDPEIQRLATEILDRVNWPWMLNGGTTLAHGWTPEYGFLPYRWDTYAELLAMYLLAIGSATHPIPASSWDAWRRPRKTYEGVTFIDADTPLFTHQYSHAWFDFRGRRDRYTNYFENSCLATVANRLFCTQLAAQYSTYSDHMWGITASDSRRGYVAWGAPGSQDVPDGTLVPCAAGGSLVFLPDECTAVLSAMLERYGDKVWGKYGFVDAFHPKDGWYNSDVIGIDQGIMLLMAENLRSESVWKKIMATPEAERGMRLVGLVPNTSPRGPVSIRI